LVIEHRPWVGDRYAVEGIDGQRIAIMGYSAYTPTDYDGYTIECVSKVVSGADRTMRFFNVIPDYFNRKAADFYARIVFFEFVPCAVGGPEQKFAVATPEQADAGRRRVLRIVQEHQVQKLLVLSAKAWSSMPLMVEAASGPLASLPGTGFRMGTYNIDGFRPIAVGLRHPQFARKAIMQAAVQAALALPTEGTP
jgi:hypothetical protein